MCICMQSVLYLLLQRKCEKYWNDDLDKPYDAGRGYSAVTTGYRGFADYEIRDVTVRNVRYISKNTNTYKIQLMLSIT